MATVPLDERPRNLVFHGHDAEDADLLAGARRRQLARPRWWDTGPRCGKIGRDESEHDVDGHASRIVRPAVREALPQARAPLREAASTVALASDRRVRRDAGPDRPVTAWEWLGLVDYRGRPVNMGTSRNSESASAVANTCPVPWCLICSAGPSSPANTSSKRSSRGGMPFVGVNR